MKTTPGSRLTLLVVIGLGIAFALVVLLSRRTPADRESAGAQGADSAAATLAVRDNSSTDAPAPAAGAPKLSWDQTWAQLSAEADSPERTANMKAALEILAAREPSRALAFALAVGRAELRDELLQGVLRGWGSLDVRAAGDWANKQTHIPRDVALTAALNGGGKDLEAITAYIRDLTSENPERTSEYGAFLVHALGLAGHHRAAADFAVGGDAVQSRQWIIASYYNWAKSDPRAALESAETLGSPEQQKQAKQSALNGWAEKNPAELAQLAINYPEGPDRKLALRSALRRWYNRDPDAAADWISRQKFTPEMEDALDD